MRRLGRGGQGAVWAARDELTGEQVAVKLLELSSSREAIEAEVRALTLLRIPGVPRLHAADLSRRFLVLDLVAGEPFPGLPVPCPWPLLAPRLAALLQVLSQVHGHGIVHADLKPDNVLADAAGQVHLVDFGISCRRVSLPPGQTGEVMGEPPWVAPEVLEGGLPTPRSDLFVTGLLAWHALQGAPPWGLEGDPYRLLDTMRARPAGALDAELPEAAEDLLRALVAVAPADRPGDATEALERLERVPGVDIYEDLVPEGAEPLSRAALMALFWGPERVLHLQSDAADTLLERTGGDRPAVRRTLARWGYAGLVAREGDRLRVGREALGRLRLDEARGLAVIPASPLPAPLAPGLKTLLAWIALAGPDASPQTLGDALTLHAAQVEAQLALLAGLGQIAWSPGGIPQDRSGGAALHAWDPLQRTRNHGRLARILGPGHPRRLRHLLAADALEEAAGEAVEVALARLDEGQGEEALTLLLQAADWARGIPELEGRVLQALASAALSTEQRAALEAARARLAGATDPGAVAPLLDLVDANAAIMDGTPGEAAQRLGAIAPFDDPRLEGWRLATWMRLVLTGPPEALEEGFAEVQRMAGEGPEARAQLAGWRGQIAYRRGHFEAAAQANQEAAALKRALGPRISSLLNAASAWLEAGRLDEAEATAVRAEELAREGRLTAYEARGARVRRAACWRAGRALAVDEELVEVARHLRERNLAGMLLLTEAAVARALGLTEALPLAQSAERTFAVARNRPGALLARCLGVALGGPPGDTEALAAEALTCETPNIGLQALGLLAPRLPDPAGALARALGRLRPGEDMTLRREILSLGEAVDRLRRPPDQSGSPDRGGRG